MNWQPQVEFIEIGRLIPYAGNSKDHPEEQIAEIAASIREFGFVKPIIVRDDLTLIAGHGALLAARKLEFARVPIIRADHLSEAQAKALVIADNKLAEGSRWNMAALKVELDGLRDMDFDLEVTGFDDDEIDRLLEEDLEDLPPAQGGEDGSKSDAPTLRLGDLTLKLTEEEARDFKAAVAEWGDMKGTTFGFINHILHHNAP